MTLDRTGQSSLGAPLGTFLRLGAGAGRHCHTHGDDACDDLRAALAPYDPAMLSISNRLKPPDAQWWSAPTSLADIFNRTIYAGRLALVGAGVVALAAAVGITPVLAGFSSPRQHRGPLDRRHDGLPRHSACRRARRGAWSLARHCHRGVGDRLRPASRTCGAGIDLDHPRASLCRGRTGVRCSHLADHPAARAAKSDVTNPGAVHLHLRQCHSRGSRPFLSRTGRQS